MFLHTMIGLLWPAHAGVALAICRACPPRGPKCPPLNLRGT
jgi:hypothetical protein